MTLTVSQLKIQTLAEDLTGIISDITDDQFVVLLNQALIQKQSELKKDVPAVFQKTTTLALNGGYELNLPTDIDPDLTKTFNLFWDENRSRATIISRNYYRRFGDVIRFDWAQSNNKTIAIEYQAVSNMYDSATMTAPVLETANPRASLYLRHEIRSLFYNSLQQNENSSAGANYGQMANRIS